LDTIASQSLGSFSFFVFNFYFLLFFTAHYGIIFLKTKSNHNQGLAEKKVKIKATAIQPVSQWADTCHVIQLSIDNHRRTLS